MVEIGKLRSVRRRIALRTRIHCVLSCDLALLQRTDVKTEEEVFKALGISLPTKQLVDGAHFSPI